MWDTRARKARGTWDRRARWAREHAYQKALEHVGYEAHRAREHVRHDAGVHVEHEAREAREHVGYETRGARKHVEHEARKAREHVRYKARRPRNLADSLRTTNFSEIWRSQFPYLIFLASSWYKRAKIVLQTSLRNKYLVNKKTYWRKNDYYFEGLYKTSPWVIRPRDSGPHTRPSAPSPCPRPS